MVDVLLDVLLDILGGGGLILLILLNNILLNILGGGSFILFILEPSPGLVLFGWSNNKGEILGLILPDFFNVVIFFCKSSVVFLDYFSIIGSLLELELDFIIMVSEG